LVGSVGGVTMDVPIVTYESAPTHRVCSEYLPSAPLSTENLYSYMSDISAHRAKPLFIAMGTITVVAFDFMLIAERWLRHRGAFPENTSWFQKTLSILSILAAIAGAVGFIILTCLDNLHHHRAHDPCM